MAERHKWADVIKAWADGATVQKRYAGGWEDCGLPSFSPYSEWRVKPEPKPDVTCEISATLNPWGIYITPHTETPNLRIVFDGETGDLKSAEVIK